jgi:hypothetical protein
MPENESARLRQRDVRKDNVVRPETSGRHLRAVVSCHKAFEKSSAGLFINDAEPADAGSFEDA